METEFHVTKNYRIIKTKQKQTKKMKSNKEEENKTVKII